MRVKNETDYDTRALGALIRAAYRHIARREGSYRRWKDVVFQVVPSRTRCSGYAYYYGTFSKLRVPPGDRFPAAWFVSLAYHEIMHLYGYRHEQYAELPGHESVQVCRAAGFEPGAAIRRKAPPKPKPKPDPQVVRYERVLAREKAWQTRLKRAQTALKKLRQQRRYYEGVLTAAGKLTREEETCQDTM